MGNIRPLLLITLVFLAYLIWLEWQKDYGPAPVTQNQATSQADPSVATPDVPMPADSGVASETPDDLPELGDSVSAVSQDAPQPEPVEAASRTIEVVTDVLRLEIDLTGGTVVLAELLNYAETVENPDEKVLLFRPSGPGFYVAQSGLLSHQSAPNHSSDYSASQDRWELADGQDELNIPLSWQSEDGVRVTKRFILRRGEYDITVLRSMNFLEYSEISRKPNRNAVSTFLSRNLYRWFIVV